MANRLDSSSFALLAHAGENGTESSLFETVQPDAFFLSRYKMTDLLDTLSDAQRSVCDELGVMDVDSMSYASDSEGEDESEDDVADLPSHYYQVNVSWLCWNTAPGTWDEKMARLREALCLTPATEVILI